MNTIHLYDFRCPKCGARPGWPCRTGNGNPRPVHAVREREVTRLNNLRVNLRVELTETVDGWPEAGRP